MKNEFLQLIKAKKIDFSTPKEEVYNLYQDLCKQLKEKYGELETYYGDRNIVKKSKDWVDIHHICEIDVNKIENIDNISSRTRSAMEKNDEAELERLKPYNAKEQLCYANKIEHFVLHYLIDIYLGIDNTSNMCWILLASIYDVAYKNDFRMSYLIQIQKNRELYFDEEDFEYIFTLANTLRSERRNKSYDYFIKRQTLWVSDPKQYFALIAGARMSKQFGQSFAMNKTDWIDGVKNNWRRKQQREKEWFDDAEASLRMSWRKSSKPKKSKVLNYIIPIIVSIIFIAIFINIFHH